MEIRRASDLSVRSDALKWYAMNFEDFHNYFSTEPPPSEFYEVLIRKFLEEKRDDAAAFANALLAQLNRATTEFLGMVQDLQGSLGRRGTLGRWGTSKACSTSFQLIVSLLRVAEMIACLSPGTFLEARRPSSRLLLTRLCQVHFISI